MAAAAGDAERIPLNEKLKALLLDDKHMFDQQKLAKLPALFTVDKIINEYREAVAANGNIADEMKNSQIVLDGFNNLLGSQLLYESERSQYSSSCVHPSRDAPGKRVKKRDEFKILPSSVYGIGHLARLFVRLDEMSNSIDTPSYGMERPIIYRELADFLNFLSSKTAEYHNLERDYEYAPRNAN